MDFGLFNQFNIREGADYHETLKEWLDLAVVSEELGMDYFWFGETHFRPNRSMLSSPLIGASARLIYSAMGYDSEFCHFFISSTGLTFQQF